MLEKLKQTQSTEMGKKAEQNRSAGDGKLKHSLNLRSFFRFARPVRKTNVAQGGCAVDGKWTFVGK